MASVPKDQWYLMVLCIFLPFLKVSVQQGNALITVGLAEGMVLECRCPWNNNHLSMVTWTKSPNRNVSIAVFSPTYGTTFSSQYHQRATFARNATHKPLDGSLELRKVTREDLGLYYCTITTFPLGSWTQEVRVQDNPPKEVKRVIRETKVEAKSGNNIVVPFSHGNNGGDDDDSDDEGSTTTRVRVVSVQLHVRHEHDNHNNYDNYDDHDDDDDQWKELASCCTTEKEGKHDDDEEEKRLKFNCTQSLDACSLWLESVTREDAGVYRCHFRTDAVGRYTTVRLIVLDPDEFSLIYIGIGATGFLLLSVFLVLLARYRKRKRVKVEYIGKRPTRQRVASDTNDYENFPAYQRPSATPNIPVYGNVHLQRRDMNTRGGTRLLFV